MVDSSSIEKAASALDAVNDIALRQKQISEINSKYKGRNKSAEMIQVIFAMLLKTYLFCYTNVSTCAAVLFSTSPTTLRTIK